MKSLLLALFCSAISLTSAPPAEAQTSLPPAPKPTAPAAAPVTYSTYHACPVSAELNKYEIRRYLTIGAITADQAREIRARKRAATRSENSFLKAQAAQMGRSVVNAATSGRLGF